MEKAKIILEDGSTKEVDSIFYLYNSRYYVIYTEKELDDNGYVVLNVVQVGKEVNQTPNGPVETGYMIGVDIKDDAESQAVQTSITKIVEDKKNNTQSPEIQYLPLNMLVNLKIVSKKTFRLLKNIVEQYFGISLGNDDQQSISPASTINDTSNGFEVNKFNNQDSDVIVDYRTKYYEEQEKNKELEKTVTNLTDILKNIKDMIG